MLNVGDRQRGRERNANTFDCGVRPAEIARPCSRRRWRMAAAPANVYGDGRAAERIVELLADTPIAPDLLDKINTY